MPPHARPLADGSIVLAAPLFRMREQYESRDTGQIADGYGAGRTATARLNSRIGVAWLLAQGAMPKFTGNRTSILLGRAQFPSAERQAKPFWEMQFSKMFCSGFPCGHHRRHRCCRPTA